MKKILITGKNSYIGSNLKQWITETRPDWMIDAITVRSNEWEKMDFSKYDAIIHTAGIAHQKITDKNRELYYSVNCDLPVMIAKKAKKEQVKQFVFMSSMSVYSDSLAYINTETRESPDNDYGKGKLKAEEKLRALDDDSFKISIVRPPMVYGKNCKGNYNSLRKLALKCPIFPNVRNQRSMIYINNLCEFLAAVVENNVEGILFPQNAELVNTSEWVKQIAKANGKSVKLSKLLGSFAMIGKHFSIMSGYINKAFGDSYYDLKMSKMPFDYQIVPFEQSVIETEK